MANDGRFSARCSSPRRERASWSRSPTAAPTSPPRTRTRVRAGRLEPRPFTLRLFLARTSDGWRVMPGGFVRVADDIDARAVSLQRGGSTGDAWVLSDEPVAETTLLPAPDRISITRGTGPLP